RAHPGRAVRAAVADAVRRRPPRRRDVPGIARRASARGSLGVSGRPMVALAFAAVALLATGTGTVAVAQEPAATVDWASTPPLSGEVVGGNARVTADASGGTFPLAII